MAAAFKDSPGPKATTETEHDLACPLVYLREWKFSNIRAVSVTGAYSWKTARKSSSGGWARCDTHNSKTGSETQEATQCGPLTSLK